MIKKDRSSNTHRVCIFFTTLLFFLHGLYGVLVAGVWIARNLSFKVLMQDNGLVAPQEAAIVNEMLIKIHVMPINTAIIGGVEVYMALLICCASCCELKKMLRVLSVVCIVFVIHNVTILAIMVSDLQNTKRLRGPLMKTFLLNFRSLYSEVTDYSASSNFTFEMDGIQVIYNCCGVLDYHDFANASHWQNNMNNKTVPESCCKLDRQLYLFSNLYHFSNGDCAKDPTPLNSNIDHGCGQTMIEARKRMTVLLVLVWCSVSILLYLFTFTLVVYQMRSFRRKAGDPLATLRDGRFLEETEQYVQQMNEIQVQEDVEAPAPQVDQTKNPSLDLPVAAAVDTTDDIDGESPRHSLIDMFWRLGEERNSVPDVPSSPSRL